MRVLLLSLGNAPAVSVCVAAYPENYVGNNLDGHEILTFGFNDGVDIRIKPEDDFNEVIRRLPTGWMPDVCILWNVEWYLLPKGIEHAPFPTVVVEMDWDYDVPLSRTIVESTDLILTVGGFEKESLLSLGATHVEIFYSQGVMKEFFCENPPKISKRTYDVYYSTLFIDDIGHPDRSKWILNLCSLSDKYNVLIGGNHNHKEYIESLRRAKLVFSYHRYGSMSSRVLDAGAQGSIVIEPGSDVKRHFKPDKAYIPITEESLRGQVERYLSDERLLQEISDRIYDETTSNFEARDRFARMIDFVSRSLQDCRHQRKIHSISESEKANRRGEVYYYSFFRANPRDFFGEIGTGTTFLRLSIEEFEKAVSIEPAPRFRTNLAVACASYDFLFENIDEEKGKRSISILEDVISKHPDYAMAYYNLCLTHLRLDNNDEALRRLNEALEIFKDGESDIDPWCLHNRDFELFNKILRKPLNQNLLLLLKGEEEKALRNIRNLYQAAMLYCRSILMAKKGLIYESLEDLAESHNLHPECGVVAMSTAERLALLGYKKESLDLYRRAIELLPLNIDLRINYIRLLYLYLMDKDVVEEINRVLKITKTVIQLREKASELKKVVEGFGRFNNHSGYSHDLAREALINSWIEVLYNCIRKNPNDLRIVLRIIELFNELGRTDKIFEILEEYIKGHLDKRTVDNTTLSNLNDIYNYLQAARDSQNKWFNKKLDILENLITDIKHETV